jgi:hypothetical protein
MYTREELALRLTYFTHLHRCPGLLVAFWQVGSHTCLPPQLLMQGCDG